MARAFASASSQKVQLDLAPVSDVPMTIACWARTASTATNQVIAAVGRRSTSSAARYQLYFRSTGHIAAFCQNSGGTSTSTIEDSAGSTYAANTWYHCCAVFGSTTSRAIYRDGGNSSTSTSSVTVGTVDTTTIGARYDGSVFGLYLNGQVAEFAVWSAALTTEEIASLAKGVSPLSIRPDSLATYTPLFGNNSPEEDWFGSTGYTVSSATKVAHPPISYPAMRKILLPAAATGPTYTLTADVGTFSLTGQPAALQAARQLVADAGSFTLSGQSAGLQASRKLVADAGAFSLSGQDAGLSAARVLTADAGVFSLSGQDATLTYTPAGTTYVLTADTGMFTLFGQDAALKASRVLTAEHGVFALYGQSVGLTPQAAGGALTGRRTPFRSYRRGRLINDELYWGVVSQDIGEPEEEVVKSATVRLIPPNTLIQDQIKAMELAVEEARTEKIRKKRAKDLALFEKKVAEEQEEQEVVKLLFELMQ